jgi:hypothetical protein
MTPPTTINAFHPDYMKTHEPDYMKPFRTMEANRQAADTLSKRVTEMRKTNPTHGFVHGIAKVKTTRPIQTKAEQSKTMAEVRQEVLANLKPREFKVYSAAGASNVTPKGKK